MKAAFLTLLLLAFLCSAHATTFASVLRDTSLCRCRCRGGRRGFTLARRECRRARGICTLSECTNRFGGSGWWCCDGENVPSADPTPSVTPSPTPSTSPIVSPAPFPKQPGVLCARSCGICDGPGCRRRPGGRANCCPGVIRLIGKSCATNEPPCVLFD